MTNKVLRKEIRFLCGLEVNHNSWFSRDEIKTISKKITPAARFISDDKSSSKYISATKIFPAYIKGWVAQDTVNDHPTRDNLLNIYKLLTEPKEQKVQQTAVVKTTIQKNIPKAIIGNEKLESILNALKTCNLIEQTDKCVVEADNSIVIKFK